MWTLSLAYLIDYTGWTKNLKQHQIINYTTNTTTNTTTRFI